MSRRSAGAALRAECGQEARALQASVAALDETVAAALGVNLTDLRCLDVLMQAERATAGELATRLGLTTGSVTALLDRLTRAGLVVRSPDPDDRRKVLVTPTEQARQAAGALYGPLAAEGDELLSGWSDAELSLIVEFLRASRQLQERHLARIRDQRRA
jgi:DNA-binding MarR family transcriptional regulator